MYLFSCSIQPGTRVWKAHGSVVVLLSEGWVEDMGFAFYFEDTEFHCHPNRLQENSTSGPVAQKALHSVYTTNFSFEASVSSSQWNITSYHYVKVRFFLK